MCERNHGIEFNICHIVFSRPVNSPINGNVYSMILKTNQNLQFIRNSIMWSVNETTPTLKHI